MVVLVVVSYPVMFVVLNAIVVVVIAIRVVVDDVSVVVTIVCPATMYHTSFVTPSDYCWYGVLLSYSLLYASYFHGDDDDTILEGWHCILDNRNVIVVLDAIVVVAMVRMVRS